MANQHKTGGEDQGADGVMVFVFVLLGVYLGFWALWKLHHTTLAMIYTNIRYIELYIPYIFGEFLNIPGISSIHHWVERSCAPSADALSWCRRDFTDMPWSEIVNSTMVINGFIVLITIYRCIKWFRVVDATHPLLRFRKTHNVVSFMRENIVSYKHLRLFSALDLIAQPLDHPVFGMSQTSRQFAFTHRLISGWDKTVEDTLIPVIDRIKAHAVFRAQLGKHWTQSADLSPAETLLVAIAMPRVAATNTALNDADFAKAVADSDLMIKYAWDQFIPPPGAATNTTYDWLTPTIDLTEPRRIIAAYYKAPTIQTILTRHAFARTVIVALFFEARRLGVLPPAEMRWLRFFDRELWYVLQNIGRQSVFAEGCAPLAHFRYEDKARHSIPEPQMDKAINALELAVKNFKYVPADRERYDQGVKTVTPESPSLSK